jgi:hypothetical protein
MQILFHVGEEYSIGQVYLIKTVLEYHNIMVTIFLSFCKDNFKNVMKMFNLSTKIYYCDILSRIE